MPSGEFFQHEADQSAARRPRVEYRIIRAGSVEELERQVNAALADRWELQGALTVTTDQAVEKYAKFEQHRTRLFLVQPVIRYAPVRYANSLTPIKQ